MVIGESSLLGDPYFLDVSKPDPEGDCPVYTAMSGQDRWVPTLAASSFAQFLRILSTAMEIAAGFGDAIMDDEDEDAFREALGPKVKIIDAAALSAPATGRSTCAAMSETAYAKSRYRPPEIEHRYGPNVHLLDDPLAWTLLARLCARETQQPEVGRLVRFLYEKLAQVVVAAEFPRARLDVPTRMVTSSPQAVVRSTGIAPQTRVVTVGIARAGTMPSQVVYDLLNEVLDPAGVRQDHLFMSRATDAQGA